MEQREIFCLLSIFCLCVFLNPVLSESKECKKIEDLKISEGCSILKGVSIKSKGGTLVNDTNCDVLLPKKIFGKEPEISFKSADKKKFYTILALDPDAPKHEPGTFFLHLLKTNVAGGDLQKGCVCSGSEIQPYIGPSPPEGTGTHHYVFLVLEQQSDGLKADKPSTRSQFNLFQWLQDKPICENPAGVIFRARHEI